MFTSAEPPPVSQIEAFSTRAAAWFMGQST
jgi:hypothetical protein